MKKTLLPLFLTMIGGCAVSPTPHFVNGRYYMGGDADCLSYRTLSPTSIMCRNADGEDTGFRYAMTDQQIQMYQYQSQIEAAQIQQLNQQLQSQPSWQPPPQYVAPALPAITPPGGNQIRCVNAGSYTNCRY